MIDWRQYLDSKPDRCGGVLCAKGTRIFVSIILASLAEGDSREQLLKSYPALRPEHIHAALAYAAELRARTRPGAITNAMKFKINENLPSEIVDDLRAAGHDADSVFAEGLSGAPDTAVLAHAQTEGRVLLTQDKDFGDVRVYPPNLYAGIILFRPRSPASGDTLLFVRNHLPALLTCPLSGHLYVVSESGIRVR